MKRFFLHLLLALWLSPSLLGQSRTPNPRDIHIPVWKDPDRFYLEIQSDPVIAAYLNHNSLNLTFRIDAQGEVSSVWSESAVNPVLMERLKQPIKSIRFIHQGIIPEVPEKEIAISLKRSMPEITPRRLSVKTLEILLIQSISCLDNGQYESASILLSGIIYDLESSGRITKLDELYQKSKLYRGFSSLYAGQWKQAEFDLTESISSLRVTPSDQMEIGQLLIARGFVRAQQENYPGAFSDWLLLARSPNQEQVLWFSNLFGQNISQAVIDEQTSSLHPLFEHAPLRDWLSTLLTGFQEMGPTGFLVVGIP